MGKWLESKGILGTLSEAGLGGGGVFGGNLLVDHRPPLDDERRPLPVREVPLARGYTGNLVRGAGARQSHL